MQMSEDLSRNSGNDNSTPSLSSVRQQHLKTLFGVWDCSLKRHSSPLVFLEKRSKIKSSGRRNPELSISTPIPMACSDDHEKPKSFENPINIGGGDEKLDLLGDLVFPGKLILGKRRTTNKNNSDAQQSSVEIPNQEDVDAKLSNRAFIYGCFVISLDDIISVSYNVGLRHFTMHSYPLKKGSFSCFMTARRSRKDLRLLASGIEEAIQ